MLRNGSRTTGPGAAQPPAGPDSAGLGDATEQPEVVPITDLTRASWRYTVRKAWAEFMGDECTDVAAALTYYAVLSIFPALLALVVAARRLRTGGVHDQRDAGHDPSDGPGHGGRPASWSDRADDAGERRRPGAGSRDPRRGLVSVRLHRRLRAGHEPDLRGGGGPTGLEAASPSGRSDPRRNHSGRGRAGRPRRQRSRRAVGRRRHRAGHRPSPPGTSPSGR